MDCDMRRLPWTTNQLIPKQLQVSGLLSVCEFLVFKQKIATAILSFAIVATGTTTVTDTARETDVIATTDGAFRLTGQ